MAEGLQIISLNGFGGGGLTGSFYRQVDCFIYAFKDCYFAQSE